MTDHVRIPVGAGSPEGTNSAYLLPDAGVVVDPGPPGDGAWDALRAGITDAGLAVESVDHVLVSHWHVDHAGLAPRLGDAAGATVHMHAADRPLLGDYAAARERRLDRDAATLERWGVPESVVTTVVDRDTPSPFPDSYDVHAREDGDVVAGVTVRHTPGHTKGHAAFVRDGRLFAGDLLLATYTPNVGGSDTRMDDPLAAYLRSLDRVADRFDRAEPGHGTTIDVASEVASVHDHHRDRAAAAFRAIADGGPATPWTVARQLFGEMTGVHAKFGAGEAAAHLRRLAALDVVERLDEVPVRYRAGVDEYPAGLSLLP